MGLSRIFTVLALILIAILAVTCVAAQRNAASPGSLPGMNIILIPLVFTNLSQETG